MAWPEGALVANARQPDRGVGHFVGRAAETHLALVRFQNGEVLQVQLGPSAFRRHWVAPGSRVRARLVTNDITSQVDATVVQSPALDDVGDHIRVYRVRMLDGAVADVVERDLDVVLNEVAGPLERLTGNTWHGPERFFSRLGLLERHSTWYENSDGLPSLLGARVIPLFHQVYAARRVLFDRTPRFVLADEVGLGKTIEAGLILQALESQTPGRNVLIVAPGTTSRQWLCELYLRFGGRVYTHLDAVEYRRRSKKLRAEALNSGKLIVTTTLLREEPEVREVLAARHVDVLVIDEAHQISSSDAVFRCLRQISAAAVGALILSATPSRRDEGGVLALLALAAPDVYAPEDLEAFRERIARQSAIWDKLSYSSAVLAAAGEDGSDVARELAEEWEGVVNDEIAREALQRMREGDEEAAVDFVAYIQEHHRLDHRIIRTRRATLEKFRVSTALRVLEVDDYEEVATPEERELAEHFEMLPSLALDTAESRGLVAVIARMLATTPDLLATVLEARYRAISDPPEHGQSLAGLTTSDVGPAEEAYLLGRYISGAVPLQDEARWLERARGLVSAWQARTNGVTRLATAARWIKQHLEENEDSKVVVFSQERPVVEVFAAVLQKEVGANAVVLSHHGLDEEAVAQAAIRFQTQTACRVLVSDELGGEGRNFQFATAVVHLDQPWHVARLEQRIGRLDRIGRVADSPVKSVVILGPSRVERALFAIHRDVFGVYGGSVGGLEFVLPRFQARIVEAAGRGADALEALAVQLREEVVREQTDIDRAFSSALDSTLPELERANDVASLLVDHDGADDDTAVTSWARQVGVGVGQGDDVTTIRVNPEAIKRPLLGIQSGSAWSRVGTFARDFALDHEDVQFFGPGHVLVDALVTDALLASEATASVFQRDLGAKALRRIFALIVVRTELDDIGMPERMSPGLKSRAYRRLWPQWIATPVELFPDDERASFDLDPKLRKQIEAVFDRETDRKLMPEDLHVVSPDPDRVWKTLRTACSAVEARVRADRVELVENAASELEGDLRTELAYLRGALARSDSLELKRDIVDRENLLRSVRGERVVLDSIALIVAGHSRRR